MESRSENPRRSFLNSPTGPSINRQLNLLAELRQTGRAILARRISFWRTVLIRPDDSQDELPSDSSSQVRLPSHHVRGPAPFAWVAVAAMFGILADRLFQCSLTTWACIGTTFTALIWSAVWLRQGTVRLVRALLLLAAIASGFGMYHHLLWHSAPPNHIVRFATHHEQLCLLDCRIRTTLTARPVEDQDSVSVQERLLERRFADSEFHSFDVDVTRLKQGHRWLPVQGRCRVFLAGELPDLRAGSCVRILGKLTRIAPTTNPGRPDFAGVLRRQQILARIYLSSPGAIRRLDLAERPAFRLPSIRSASLRHSARDQLAEHFPARHFGLMSTLMLGVDDELDRSTREQFAKAGISHILAISGLHIGLLVAPILVLGRWGIVRMPAALLAAIALAWCYCWLVDFKPPIVRASIMITVFAMAKLLCRRSFTHNSLGCAACIVLAIDPTALFSVGTQLSFIAFATICSTSDRQSALSKTPMQRMLRSCLSRPEVAILSAAEGTGSLLAFSCRLWLATTPLALRHFHLLSPVGILINPIVALPTAIMLYGGFSVILFGQVHNSSAHFVAQVTSVCCDLLSDLVVRVDQSSFGWSWQPAPPWWWVIGFYGLWFLRQFYHVKVGRRRATIAILAWLSVGLVVNNEQAVRRLIPNSTDRVRITWIDVGHGTSAAIELPDGNVILYDAGSMSGGTSAAEKISGVLWSRGIKHVDAVILSHADADHFVALPGLIERFSIGRVYCSEQMLGSNAPDWSFVKDRIRFAKIPIDVLAYPTRLKTNSRVEVQVLHPHENEVWTSDNEASVVLSIRLGRDRIILTGDIEKEGLRRLLDQHDGETQVLMAPHHGSVSIPILHLLSETNPDVVVISSGSSQRGRTSIEQYSQSGATVFHTSEAGAVTILLDGQGMRCSTHVMKSPQADELILSRPVGSDLRIE